MNHTPKALRRAKTPALICILLLMLASGDLKAFTYTNFSSLSGLSLVGNATQITNQIRLTTTLQSQSGAVWYAQKQTCASGFSTTFHFRITNPGSIAGLPAGGDGIAFSVQNVGTNAAGSEYGAPSNNIGITFNTFYNPQAGEPSDNLV